MGKFKALVADFDNTLAGLHTFEITIKVKQSVIKLLNSGYSFSIVTGKPYAGVIQSACKELNLKDPQIIHGGSVIIDPVSEKIIWKRYINDNDSTQIIAFLQNNNIFFTIEKDNYIYSPQGKHLKFYGETTHYKSLDELSIKDIAKIVVPASINKLTNDEVDRIIKQIQLINKNVHIIKAGIQDYFGFDITHISASKYSALIEYMKILNLKKEEVVGVGDGYNDLPLLKACGVKIAMGDAPQELIEIADFVVPTQKEDGLVFVIDNYFNIS